MAEEKQFQTINGAFSIKGEDVQDIGWEFFDWCQSMETKYGVVIMSNRADYNGYWPMDRKRTKE